MLKRIMLVGALLLIVVAGPVAAQRIMLVKEDQNGATFYDVADYLAKYGPSALLDSALAEGARLIDTYPNRSDREEMWSLNATGQWTLSFDLDMRPPYAFLGLTGFENDSGLATPCTLTIFPGRLFINPALSDCFKQSVVAHEYRHVRDYIDGKNCAFTLALNDTLTPIPLSDFIQMFEDEARGYMAQASFALTRNCADQYPETRAFAQYGEAGLRYQLLVRYRAFNRFPAKRGYLEWVANHPPRAGQPPAVPATFLASAMLYR